MSIVFMAIPQCLILFEDILVPIKSPFFKRTNSYFLMKYNEKSEPIEFCRNREFEFCVTPERLGISATSAGIHATSLTHFSHEPRNKYDALRVLPHSVI